MCSSEGEYAIGASVYLSVRQTYSANYEIGRLIRNPTRTHIIPLAGMTQYYRFIGIARYMNDWSPDTGLMTIGLFSPLNWSDMLSASIDWKQSAMYL